jgi:hypothetical protein
MNMVDDPRGAVAIADFFRSFPQVLLPARRKVRHTPSLHGPAESGVLSNYVEGLAASRTEAEHGEVLVRVPSPLAIRIAALPSDPHVLLSSPESNMPVHQLPATTKPCSPRSPDHKVSLRATTLPRRLAPATS